jgi:hypothetical protein
MKNLILIILVALFSNCNLSTDRTNAQDVAKALLKAVIENDTIQIKELYVYKMDSIDIDTKKSMFKELIEYRNKEYEVLRIDTTYYDTKNSTGRKLRFDKVWRSFEIFFKIDTNYMSLRANYEADKSKNLSICFFSLKNLSRVCNEYNTQPYCPEFYIKFRHLDYTTDYTSMTFNKGEIEIENHSQYDFASIKFRIKLRKKYGDYFFNQTVIANKKVYSKDIVRIEIPELTDYYTGFVIDNNNFEFDAELIELLPKPSSSNCEKLEELKKLK